MKLTVANIRKITNGGKLKANVSVNISSVGGEDTITVNDIKIFDGQNGLFVSMPSMSYQKDGETKRYAIVKLSDNLMKQVSDAVLAAYQEAE